MSSEKRLFRRIRCCVAEYYLPGKPETAYAALIKDMSAGGICLITTQKPPSGRELMVKVYLPSACQTLEMRSRLVRSVASAYFRTSRRKHYEMALEFIGLEPRVRKCLEEYLGSVWL